MISPISITGISAISALGFDADEIWNRWKSNQHHFTFKDFGKVQGWGSFLTEDLQQHLLEIAPSDSKYKNLDETVLMAIATSRKAVQQAAWKSGDTFGVNLGSSRGATALFEKHHETFLETGKAPLLTSPVTTLGNISSWVAQDLGTSGPEISHSITCSTSLHAVLNGVVWLQSGMCDKFLVGGSESPLTAFTVAQMQALKIYSKAGQAEEYPSRASDFAKTTSSMILGQAAAVCCLESGKKENALAQISGIGYATEPLVHGTSISAEAQCLQDSMKMALQNINPKEIDAIILHAPGTVKGDFSELSAIRSVFGNHEPLLTTTKWKSGHTFGAAGLINIELAVQMLQRQYFIGTPFTSENRPEKLRHILVNSVGFGGNAVSVVVSQA